MFNRKNRNLCAYIDLIWKIPEVEKYLPNQLHELSCCDTYAAILGELIDADVVTSCDESTDILNIKKVENMSPELWEMMLSYAQHETNYFEMIGNITSERRVKQLIHGHLI